MNLTIGIASYNQQEYLPDAIESALDQTIPCEVIVCNDGATDHSLEIARKYPVKVINQKNKGLASARNSIIMNMRSTNETEYFLPLDADDILYEHCAETILRVAAETDADIVAPSLRCFGLGNENIIIKDNITLQDFKEGNRLPYCSAIKKEALLEVGGYSPRMDNLGGYEDLALWLDLLIRGKTIATIQEPLVMYRTKENSMWREASKSENHRKLMGQIFKDYPEAFPTEELRNQVLQEYPKRS